jgi:phosphate transport system substrate-binding protein
VGSRQGPNSPVGERGGLAVRWRLPSWLHLLVMALLLVNCGEPLATPEPVFVEAAGSRDVAPLVVELAQAFEERSPLVTIDVDGLGTAYGLQALRAGEVDVALASWLLPESGEADGAGQRLDPGWRATVVARDGLAIVVHPDNPLDELGLLQLQDLFSGRTYEWTGVATAPGSEGMPALGEVQPVSREEASGTQAAFEALVMDDQRVTPRAVLRLSPEAVVEYVAATPNAIGYVSMGYVRPDVKVLQIEGLLPTPDSTATGAYPLSREFWLVAVEPVPEAVQDFIDFALSPAGQQIVGRRYGRVR